MMTHAVTSRVVCHTPEMGVVRTLMSKPAMMGRAREMADFTLSSWREALWLASLSQTR